MFAVHTLSETIAEFADYASAKALAVKDASKYDGGLYVTDSDLAITDTGIGWVTADDDQREVAKPAYAAALKTFRCPAAGKPESNMQIIINGKQIEVPVGAIAYKYADPTEGARWVYEQADLEDIRREDPSLLISVDGDEQAAPEAREMDCREAAYEQGFEFARECLERGEQITPYSREDAIPDGDITALRRRFGECTREMEDLYKAGFARAINEH